MIFEIKSYKRFNVKTTKNVKKFCCRIYATYSTWFTIFDRDTTWVRMTEFYYHNIKCVTKTKEAQKQYSYYKKILKWWENKCVDVRHQITSCQQQDNKINETIFEQI